MFRNRRLLPSGLLIVLFYAGLPDASLECAQPQRLEFTRMVAHWADYDDPQYLPFIEQAQPEIVQLGFYGAHFWSLADTPQYKGYPAHFPVRELDECGNWFQNRNEAVHQRGAKVIGHFNVEFLVGDPRGDDGATGFFKFYRDLWDEKLLGPKPVDDPLEFLERDANGTPIRQNAYSIGGMAEHWACLRNPDWQTVLKAWVKVGIDRGLDGFIANYFYRHNCLCKHCQSDFREYLGQRYTAPQLRKNFGIENLKQHRLDELIYWHQPQASSLLRREMLRWSQLSNKSVFDEVFIRYGRSLKPNLIVAQWNHLGIFHQVSGDERCLLPADAWGRDEDYLWYSTGGAACFTDLAQRNLGEGTLQARYIRGAFDDKPFTLGKYENTRVRVAIAELAANGGAPMGFYTRFTDPAARAEIVRYYQFLKRYDSLYRANRPHAEAVLLYPRKAVHEANVQAVEAFRKLGGELLDAHLLFDVLPDDAVTAAALKKYRHVLSVENADIKKLLKDEALSRSEAPFTVRVSASRSADGDSLALHLVNYNRKEPPKGRDGRPSAGGGIKDEQPIAARNVAIDFVLPDGRRPKRMEWMSPESPEPRALEATRNGNRLSFTVPEVFVYTVIRLSDFEG